MAGSWDEPQIVAVFPRGLLSLPMPFLPVAWERIEFDQPVEPLGVVVQLPNAPALRVRRQ